MTDKTNEIESASVEAEGDTLNGVASLDLESGEFDGPVSIETDAADKAWDNPPEEGYDGLVTLAGIMGSVEFAAMVVRRVVERNEIAIAGLDIHHALRAALLMMVENYPLKDEDLGDQEGEESEDDKGEVP